MIFKNDISKQKTVEKKLILNRLPFYLGGILVADLIMYIAKGSKIIPLSFAVFHGLMAMYFFFISLMIIRQSRKYYSTYELEITDEFIEVRNQTFSKRIIISEIKTIHRHSSSIIMITDSRRNKIAVSSEIENYEEAYRLISRIMPVSKPPLTRYYNWFILVTAILYASSLAFRNFFMYVVFCPLFALSIFGSLIIFVRNKDVKIPGKIIMSVFYLYIVFLLVNGFITVLSKCL